MYKRRNKLKNKQICKKKVGIFFLVLFLLILELDRESGHIKHLPYMGTYDYQEYNNGTNIVIKGAWDVSYPTTVEVRCNYYKKECKIDQAEILFETLSYYGEEYDVIYWDKELIKATTESPTYNFELTLNRKMQTLTQSRYPKAKETILGYETTEEHFKLMDPVEIYTKLLRKEQKKLSWWNNLLFKLIFFR